MAPLSPASACTRLQQALSRLRAYVPPPTLYTTLPATSRAAVLLLLFADRRGELKVVLTVRSAALKSFSGHVAFPGGKADTPHETPQQTARREAFEEIGLPLSPSPPYRIEHLTELPLSLAVTHMVVRPVVAFLHDETPGQRATEEEVLRPLRVDPAEVQCVFTVGLERFLGRRYGGEGEGEGEGGGDGVEPEGVDGVGWYKGRWLPWNGGKWKAHEFQAPVWTPTTMLRHRVWGMTARILVDAARIAYARDPEFSFVEEVGDEGMIKVMWERGELGKGKEEEEGGGGEKTIYTKPEAEVRAEEVEAEAEGVVRGRGNL